MYDWRVPLVIYYNGTLVTSPTTRQRGSSSKLTKKRQFLIQNGQIESMFDTNEKRGDEMLQRRVGAAKRRNHAKHRGDDPARAKRHHQRYPFRLTGRPRVAGSGKTSAILQRIAFLLYHSRQELQADQIVLFSPNKLFSHYISDVLPSLGERNMRQVTLADFLTQRLQGLNVESLFDRYEKDLDLTPEQQALVDYKSSSQYMHQIADYCQHLAPTHFKFNHIYFNGRVFFDKTDIEQIYQGLPHLQPAERFLRTKNILIKRLKHRIGQEAKSDWVAEEIDQLSDEQYHNSLGSKRRHDFQEIDAETNYIARKIVTRRLRKVYDAIYNNYFLDIYSQYADFMDTVTLPDSVSAKIMATDKQNFSHDIEFHRCELVDAAPLLYIRDILTGGGQNHAMQHVRG